MRRGRLVFRLLVALGAVAVTVTAYVLWIVGDVAGGTVFRNSSGAMDSTLLAGDRFTVEPFPDARVAQSRARHGVIVAHTYPPDSTKSFVKRLVGLPGDTLAMVGGVLRRNGRVVDEPYAWHAEPVSDSGPTRNDWGPLVVPPGAYFVLGDNRDNSLDSRYWGFVKTNHLRGEVRRVYFSRDPESGAIRWRRLGRRVR